MAEKKWLKAVQEAFNSKGPVMLLTDIYQYVASHYESDYKDNPTWHAQIRRVIYQHSSDCDIYNGKDDLFISEDGKGNGIWRMRMQYVLNDEIDLFKLPIGALVNASQISSITGVNQAKGIHPLDSEMASAVILCTIGGMNYPNQWIQKNQSLKYYLEGRISEGEKKYNPNIKSNKAVSDATTERPVLVFVRNRKSEKFTFFGKFTSTQIIKESDGAMYFLLQKNGTHFHIDEVLTSEDDEGFPEGRLKERLHKSRERNERLVKEAKEQFKKKYGTLFCEVCGFDFEKSYGEEIGKDFIEAHHKIPVSELKEGDKTKISDLAMVCANCHRMLHRSRPWKSPDDLKAIISQLS